MGVYGEIAVRAWSLAAHEGMSPPTAWVAAVGERYPILHQRKNALQHTCPKCAFLGLCEDGLLRDIAPGKYTTSVKGKRYALATVEQLRANPSLLSDKRELKAQVYGKRTPNDEVDVVLSLWEQDLVR